MTSRPPPNPVGERDQLVRANSYMPDWNDFRYFLAVAETGSLSGAARQLGVSQPTVGRRIEALEQSLKARLFDRLSHGYALAPAGENIRELVERMEHEALSVSRRVSGENIRLDGEVSVATSEGLGVHWLVPRLPHLRERHRSLEIELKLDVQLADLLRREADVALRLGSPGSDALIGRRLGMAAFGLYASRDYLEQHGVPDSTAELNGHVIVESTGASAGLPQARALRALAPAAVVSLRCDRISGLAALGAAGVGLVPLPVYVGSAMGETGGLVRVLGESFEPHLDLWLLTHRDLRHTARVRALMDFLREEFEAERDSGSGVFLD